MGFGGLENSGSAFGRGGEKFGAECVHLHPRLVPSIPLQIRLVPIGKLDAVSVLHSAVISAVSLAGSLLICWM